MTGSRVCCVPDCKGIPTNADGFLCKRHWFRVPKKLRDRVWDLFRTTPGSHEHKSAVAAAIAAAREF